MITQQLNYGPYSPSRLDVALCPYRFMRQYITRDAPPDNSEAANKGAAVHHAFEMIVNAAIANKPLPSIDDCVKSALFHFPLKQKVSFDFLKLAVTLFHAEPTRMFNPKHVVGVEELLAINSKYEPVDYDNPLAMLRGKADILLIEGDVATIIDHKNQLNVEDADTFQMGVYALLVLCTYPYVREVKTILHFSAPDLNFYSKPAIWKRDELEDFKAYVESRIMNAETIAPGTESVIPGRYCQYCSMCDTVCPQLAVINEQMLFTKIGPISDAATAEKYVRAYVFLDELSGTLQSHLRDYVSNIGPIGTGDAIVEIRESGGRAYDAKKAVLDVLEKHKVNPEPYLKIDGTLLKKLMEGKDTPQALKDDLEKVTYKKPTLRMGVYKNKK